MAYKDDDGRLNNFAREPEVYQAQPLNSAEKRNNLIILVVGTLLVGGLITVAYYASSTSVG